MWIGDWGGITEFPPVGAFLGKGTKCTETST